ncbi:MAG: M50 family metallopeptidase [Ignavibacteriae bacterium]|nr:M50 family metallopeptidase [Ignavibacteriota bacterium]
MTRADSGALAPRTQLLAVAALTLLSLVFWDSVVLAPVKLFVVLLHELCHGAAAVLTGGEIVRIEIDPRIGGACLTRGGWEFLVVSSGYLGSLLLGGVILLLAGKRAAAPALAWGIGLGVLAVTLAFVRNGFGLFFGIAFGAGMIALARFLPRRFLDTALLYLGTISALYAVVDIKEDLLTLEPRLTDAAILASMTGVPAIIWGLLWSALSLLMLFLLFRVVLRSKAARNTPAP